MNEKNIVEVSSDGISYVGEKGERRFIAFMACYQRYLDRWNDPVYLKSFKEANSTRSDDELELSIKRMRTVKEIGGRDFTVPFIGLYTDPLTEFYFSDRAEYDKIVYLVRKTGWRLRDWA